jgi:hypothetical protein
MSYSLSFENILENIFGFREGKLNKENATRMPTVPSRTYLKYEGEIKINCGHFICMVIYYLHGEIFHTNFL